MKFMNFRIGLRFYKKLTIKRFDFISVVEVWAENRKEAEKIMDDIKLKNEFPDGSIIDDTVNFPSWKNHQVKEDKSN